jgi:hypothetical protein
LEGRDCSLQVVPLKESAIPVVLPPFVKLCPTASQNDIVTHEILDILFSELDANGMDCSFHPVPFQLRATPMDPEDASYSPTASQNDTDTQDISFNRDTPVGADSFVQKRPFQDRNVAARLLLSFHADWQNDGETHETYQPYGSAPTVAASCSEIFLQVDPPLAVI